jgi:hypothetical protein
LLQLQLLLVRLVGLAAGVAATATAAGAVSRFVAMSDWYKREKVRLVGLAGMGQDGCNRNSAVSRFGYEQCG